MPAHWYEPQNASDALDCLEDISTILAFLRDTIPQNPDESKISDDGAAGLYFLLDFLAAASRRSVNQITKRRKAL